MYTLTKANCMALESLQVKPVQPAVILERVFVVLRGGRLSTGYTCMSNSLLLFPTVLM